MSKVQIVFIIVIDLIVVVGVVQFFFFVVFGFQVLIVNGKQVYWYVCGVNFIGVYEFFDMIVVYVGDFVDIVVECIVVLGLLIDVCVFVVVEKVGLIVVVVGFVQFDEFICVVIFDIDVIFVDVKVVVDGFDEVDLISQDVVIEIQCGFEKDCWFLVLYIVV